MTEYNKVVYDGQTLIDLTQDDVTESDVLAGVYFHKADGTRSVGTFDPTIEIDFYNDYGTSLYNATSSSPWTAPESGIMVVYMGTTSGQRAYWYVNDKTTGYGLARATRLETSSYQLGATFPIIKGHQYYSEKANLSGTPYAHLYVLKCSIIK